MRWFTESRKEWDVMTFYERFEHVVAVALTAVISVIIVAALFRLLWNVFVLLVLGALDPTEYSVFQAIFGMIMTVLIALEFKHSILKVVARKDSIIQVKTVILIALLAISRKFIILDIKEVPASSVAALAGSVLALGLVYWLMRERDDRLIYQYKVKGIDSTEEL